MIRRVPRARGFSVVELLLVILIISVLVGVAVPFFQDNLSESLGTRAAQDLSPQGPATWLGALVQGTSKLPRPHPEFLEAALQPRSTFSMDVDTGSYTLVRQGLRNGILPPGEAVRAEEFLNSFDHAYPLPKAEDFALHQYLVPSRTDPGKFLLQLGIQARDLRNGKRPPLDLTFVVDLSGSMGGRSRLGLVKQSLGLLLENLLPEDRLALVTFSDSARNPLPSTPVLQKATIQAAIDALETGGSTNFVQGLDLGYQVASQNVSPGRARRLVFCSDGAPNQGVSSLKGLVSEIRRHAQQSGVLLTCLGFGMGSERDPVMEQLADQGDGFYAYIDGLEEARKLLVEKLTGTLIAVARDCKIQVEFDPARVFRYRRIGYQNRTLQDHQFRDDSADAAEVGVKQSVTALYLIELREKVPLGSLGRFSIRWAEVEGEEVRELQTSLPSKTGRDEDPESLGIPRRSEWIAAFAWALKTTGEERRRGLEVVLQGLLDLQAPWADDAETQELVELVSRALRLAQ